MIARATQECFVIANDIEAAVGAAKVILEAVTADTAEARAELKSRMEDLPTQVAVLRGAKALLAAGGVSKLLVEIDPRLLREGGSSAEELMAMTHAAGFQCGYGHRQFACAQIEGLAGQKCWNDLYCTKSRSDFCERHWLAPFRTNAVWPFVPRHCVRFDSAAFTRAGEVEQRP